MNCIMESFLDHPNFVFIDRVPNKHKSEQFHSILVIAFQKSLFSPHMHKVTFSA